MVAKNGVCPRHAERQTVWDSQVAFEARSDAQKRGLSYRRGLANPWPLGETLGTDKTSDSG